MSLSRLPDLLREIRKARRVLVVAGQHLPDEELRTHVRLFSENTAVPVVADSIANLNTGVASAYQGWDEFEPQPRITPDFALHAHDVFLAGLPPEQQAALRPDLLITFGQSLISKSLKLFLRAAAPKQHWHIQAAGEVADTFRSLTRIVRLQPIAFFWGVALEAELDDPPLARQQDYYAAWQQPNTSATGFLADFFRQPDPPFNEFSAIQKALQLLPEQTALHLANSMAVRYANILGLPAGRPIEVFANRGTSGIDGCTSTAVGAALAQPERPVVLLTGDVAFFYDRNAFWQNYPTPNLRVVLLNNHGGGIFRLIDGPRQQPELEEFFETRQPLMAENTARDFGLRYFPAATFAELDAALPVFFAAEGGAAILEITTDSQTNAAFFDHYRHSVKLHFNSL